MSFVYPLGLLGLLSLPVILIIHLLRERQRRYVVSNLRLWSFLDMEHRGPRTRRIPFTWLLLLDLLIGAFLSLALAQPRLNLSLPFQTAHHLIVVMDVSSSMRVDEGVGNRLGQAKTEAINLLDDLGPKDVATVLTFGRSAHWVGDSRQDDFSGLMEKVAAIQAGETGHALEAALALGEAAIDPKLPIEFVILTDGAFPEPEASSLSSFTYPLSWRFFGGDTGNQAVLGLNALSVGENQFQVFTRIANFGAQNVSRSVSILTDGRQIDTVALDIPAESSVPQVWTLQGNPESVMVALEGTDRLEADDRATTILQQGGEVRVALVAENPSPLQQALNAVPEAEVTLLTPAEYQANSQSFEFTVFRGWIPAEWPTGQVLLVEPPSNSGESEPIGLTSIGRREILPTDPLQIPTQSELLQGIDFGGVRWTRAWALENVPDSFNTLVQAGDDPLLIEGTLNNQGEVDLPATQQTHLFVLLADLERGNFTKHPAFPILMANLVQSVRHSALPASVPAGEEISLPQGGQYESLKVTGPNNTLVSETEALSATWNQTLEPGLYRFQMAGANGEAFEYVAGVNAGDETESDVRPRAWIQNLNPSGAEQEARTPASSAGVEDQHLELLPYLLGLAALALILEAVVAWRSS